jgi:hypothetical protein
MEYLIGIVLAIAAFFFARFVGLDRDRAFYPTVLIVIALLYGLFAAIGGSGTALALESIGIVGFVLLAVLGFKSSLWLVVAALFGHGVYDFFHPHLFVNPGAPAWWPEFCMAYDVTASAGLAWLLWRDRAGRDRAADVR